MADRKISDLTALTTQASGDLLPIVDVSEAAAADKNKSITVEELFQGIPVDVGVGTASPAFGVGSGVEIQRAGSATLRIEDSNSSSGFEIQNASGNITFNGYNDQQFIFTHNTTERVRIDSSGRLLVGTSTARAVGGESNPRLQIEGSGATSSSWMNLTRFADSTGAAFIQFGKSRSDTPGTYTVVQNNDTLGGIAFAGADGTDLATYGARITAEVDGTPGSNDMPGRLVFSTNSGGASPSERMRIDSQGKLFTDRTVSDTTGSHPAVEINTTSTGTAANSFATGIDFQTEGTTRNRLAVTTNNNWIFYRDSGSNEALRIDSSGRLLINTSSEIDTGTATGSVHMSATGGGKIYMMRDSSSVAAGSDLGMLRFYSNDGGEEESVRIEAEADAAHSAGDKPGRLVFRTSASGSASPSERMRIDSNGDTYVGNVGQRNTTQLATGKHLQVVDSTNGAQLSIRGQSPKLFFDSTSSGKGEIYLDSSHLAFFSGTPKTAGTERVRIDSSGRLLVGTSSGSGSGVLIVQGGAGTPTADAVMTLRRGGNNPISGSQALGQIRFEDLSGGFGAQMMALADGTWSTTTDCPTALLFSTTADGSSSPTERMRITSGGDLLFGKTGDNFGTAGAKQKSTGTLELTADGTFGLAINRLTNDGELVRFYQATTQEGSITVSGSTVSYNGAHLSRWSQLPSGVERTEILRGSVLSNIDEMCDWGEEENEQLNRMQVSDVEGDRNVAGVFQDWDDDDDTYTNDFYCAMTGDFIIRIAQGVTVERGDLLISAGDGTAKPQDDDIIRSKTIAKVTSANVSCTYDDGSYCVPCVLMAC